MLWLLKRFHLLLHYLLLPVRYKVSLKSSNTLKILKQNQNGILFLSNHTSNIDATLISTCLVKQGYEIDIWAYDFVFKLPYLSWVSQYIDRVKVKKVPVITDQRYTKAKNRVNRLVKRTIDGLKKGRNCLIFPSGHSKYEAKEKVRGSSSIYRILQQFPEATIVLVRIKGLWGSRFSWAAKRNEHWSSERQRWWEILVDVAKLILLNGLFFMPKREVVLEFIPAPQNFPRYGTKDEINHYLEQFYNSAWGVDGEPLQSVPNYFWSNTSISHEQKHFTYQFDLSQVPLHIKEEVIAMIKEKLPDKEAIDSSDLLRDTLGLDSLELTEILIDIETRYGVTQLVPAQVTTVGHLMAIAAHIKIEEKVITINLDSGISTHDRQNATIYAKIKI